MVLYDVFALLWLFFSKIVENVVGFTNYTRYIRPTNDYDCYPFQNDDLFRYVIKFSNERILHILLTLGAKCAIIDKKNIFYIRVVYDSSYRNTNETNYLLLQSHSHVF